MFRGKWIWSQSQGFVPLLRPFQLHDLGQITKPPQFQASSLSTDNDDISLRGLQRGLNETACRNNELRA